MLDIVCLVPCPWSMNVHKAFEDYVNLWYVENWMCLLEALWKYTPTLFFGPKLQKCKKYGTQHIVQNICISRHENLPKAYNYISCGIYCLLWCLKKEMLTMCFDIRCRKTYILSHSHSFLRKKVDYLLWSLSTRHKRPIVIIVEVQYELGNGKLTHMIINRCWMIPYLISAKNIHIS